MAMSTKQMLVRGGVGVAGAILCIVAMAQRSGKNKETAAKDAALAECDSIKKELVAVQTENEILDNRVGELSRELSAAKKLNDNCGEQVEEYLDSIAVLNRRLAECQQAKKVKKASKKKVAKKPVETLAQRRCASAPVSNNAGDANVKINNGGCNNTNITNINNGDTVNNYYGAQAPKKACDEVVTVRRTRTIQITFDNCR